MQRRGIMSKGLLLTTACSPLLLTCCRHQRSLTPMDFNFATKNTTYAEIIQKVGVPNRVYPPTNNTVTLEWDLVDTEPGTKYIMLCTMEDSLTPGSFPNPTNRMRT